MAVLSTYINVSTACLIAGQNCFAHGLPTTPDFAIFANQSPGGANVCVPVAVCRGGVGVNVLSPAAGQTEALWATFHSIIR